MKAPVRSIAFVLVSVFLFSLVSGMITELYHQPAQELEPEPVVQEAPTDPGHAVFAQYLTSDNCGYCYQYGSPAHNQAKNSLPDRYVYISYHSANFGNTADSEAGNIAPIYGVSHLGETSGAPKTSFGDAAPNTGCGSNTCWDQYISNGGNMHSTAGDYSILISQTDNSGTTTIDISATYVGSGSPPSSLVLYAAVTEKVCNSHTYSDGSKGGNCWESWLLNNGGYTSASGGVVNGGTAFETVSLGSGKVTKSWTVPTNLVSGGVSNMNTVAALYSTWSTSNNNAAVYGASDSTMGPKMDIGVTDLVITNDIGTESYVRGDTVTLDAEVSNTGDLDYTSGGSLEFFYKNGATLTAIGTVSLPSLSASQGAAPFTGTTTFDTSNLPSNVWSTTFGARLTGLSGDNSASNNVGETPLNHDRSPLAKSSQVIGSDVVQRGDFVTLLAKGDANDNVDTIDTMTFEIEVSSSGQNTWDSSIVSGGDKVLYRDSAQEGREYIITPSMTMSAGEYDVRTRTVDSRGQTSIWSVSNDMFELANGRPMIVADPVPTVMCDISTKVSMVGHVMDPETPLSDLIITSDSSNFVAWHADSEELEVSFPYDNGCPLGQKGIEIKVDDGGDYTDTGELPYGTLLFNIIENGQPRWGGLPIQVVEEGSSGVLSLSEYLSDTDDTGQSVETSTLSLQILENSNPELITVELRGNTIGYETVDDDVNGETVVTLRASDGEQFSDQTLTIRINPINDAPRLDMTDIEEFSLKTNRQKVINLNSRLTDVDSPQGTYWVNNPQSTETGSARLVTGDLILEFEEVGLQTVTISTTDGYATNSYQITVNVFDALPLYISKTDDGSGHLYVGMTDTYETQTPTANFALTESAPTFTVITVSWSLCNELSGTCDGFWEYDLDMSRSNTGWTQEMNIPSVSSDSGLARVNGMRNMDYIGLTVRAVDDSGQEYKTSDTSKWLTTEALPDPVDMDDALLEWYVADLTEEIDDVETQLSEQLNAQDKASLEARLMELNTKFDVACDDPRADCPTENVQSNGAGDGSSGLNTNVIFIVIGVLIVAALLGLMFMRSRRDEIAEPKWNEASLPFHDAVANSMYGGTQELFQQPVAAIAPVAAVAPIVAPAAPVVAAPIAAPAGPPLPPGGLPAGWTMEQWTYYGQQYLDRLNHQQ